MSSERHKGKDSTATREDDSTKKNPEDEESCDKDYANWPMKDIKEPHQNDVLYGRGGGTNHHSGNKRYRKMVETRKVDYVNSKRLDKPLVALEIIKEWRDQVPRGRFLKMDESTSMWNDVGDKKAREKTSQALREKAPQLRKQQEEERMENMGLNTVTPYKNTRFNVPESNGSKSLKPATLARDHSLGRDFVSGNEPLAVDNFSWDSPIDPGLEPMPKLEYPAVNVENWKDSHSPSSPASASTSPNKNRRDSEHYENAYDNYNPVPINIHRSPSHRHDGTPHRQHSLGQNILPGASTNYPAQNPFTMNNGEPLMMSHPSTSTSDEQWAPLSVGSNDNSYRSPASDSRNQSNYRADEQSIYGSGGTTTASHSSEHDTYKEPIQNDYADWQGRSNIESEPMKPGQMRRSRTPHDVNYRNENPAYFKTPAEMWRSPSRKTSRNNHPLYNQGQPPLAIDTLTHQYPYRTDEVPLVSPSEASTPSRSPGNRSMNMASPRAGNANLAKPQPVKRDTSNQNETSETKPRVKRMNRNRSIGTSSPILNEVSEHDMTYIGNTLKHSKLEPPLIGKMLPPDINRDTSPRQFAPTAPSDLTKLARPDVLKNSSQRIQTIDRFDLDFETSKSSFDSEVDQLDPIKSLEKEPSNTLSKPGNPTSTYGYYQPGSSIESVKVQESHAKDIPKPSLYSDKDRLSTLGSVGLDFD